MKAEKISSLAMEASEVEKDSPGFMEPGSRVKGKRGPKGPWKHKEHMNGGTPDPANQKPGAQPLRDPVAELRPLTDQAVTFYSNLLVQYAEDERARLVPQTHEILSQSSAMAMNQYFPNAIGAHASLIVILLVVGQTGMNAHHLRRENLEKLRAEKAMRDSIVTKEKK